MIKVVANVFGFVGKYELREVEAAHGRAAAAVKRVMRLQAALSTSGNLNVEVTTILTPLRGALSFCYFFFGQAKKK